MDAHDAPAASTSAQTPPPPPASPAHSTSAPAHALPTTHFYSIEYPGYVQPSAPSLAAALHTLGGQARIDRAFRRGAPKEDALLELSLRPDDPFAHPLPGDLVPTHNLLLRVVKRRRRDGAQGEYVAAAAGIVPKTTRFRSMADFQYRPPQDDPLARLRRAMTDLDVDGIRAYHLPAEKEDYTAAAGPDPSAMDVDIDPALQLPAEPAAQSAQEEARSALRLFPPPIFSRQGIPQNYNFKANPMSVVADADKRRLINKARWKGFGPTSIAFAERGVPARAPPHVEEVRAQYDPALVARLEELFRTRPVWTRAALLNQFSPAQAREIHNSKVVLPLTCYVFGDGPWRDTMVRFGYDPRADPQARFYQKLYFRNLNHPIGRARDDRRCVLAHLDGATLSSETAAFQLCDITDPMLKRMIEEEEDVRENCNERDGWFSSHALERIKTVLRHKFFALLEGYVATEDECLKLLDQQDGVRAARPFARRPRPGKHNMAKGAMPAEDAAALRLRATLERNAAMNRGLREPTAEGA
ncbi:RNA polymerase III transcription factor IIIC subunit-domain-containing protein [Gloeopeniophorella convolvens]|nr:RNA polymerase III transcription factor IIIC subunit-domain-containing protein [Gloeopeniophorella convolvens]